MSTQFQWSSTRQKAALALAEGHSQQAVAEAIGVCRKTICNWLCVPEFITEIDRLSCMVDIASRAERLRMAMRVVRQKVRADGTVETDKDVLDWLKYVQSETDGAKIDFSKLAEVLAGENSDGPGGPLPRAIDVEATHRQELSASSESLASQGVAPSYDDELFRPSDRRD
jgi:Homeodomain-like domain-containing protein